MRYKIGDPIPDEQLTAHASDDMLLLTAILGFFIGLILIALGRFGKQIWMWVWGIGLVIISLYLACTLLFGIRLFTYF